MRPIRPAVSTSPAAKVDVVKPKACIPCRTRKVKCERSQPCTNCTKWSIECVFPSPRRTCRRRAKGHIVPIPTRTKNQPSHTDNETNDTGLEARLQNVERLLLQLMPQDVFSHEEQMNRAWQLFARSASPANRPERLKDMQTTLTEILASMTRQPDMSTNIPFSFTAPSPSRFPVDTFNLDASSLQPSQDLMRICWATYLQSFDPLVKVLHRPSTERILCKASSTPEELRPGESALLFTIYSASLSRLPADMIEERFGLPKLTAMGVYRGAVEHALSRAGIFTTEDLVTLQAVVVFLSTDRFGDNARRAWALSGLASRLGSCTKPDISAFEKEMRTRLRWSLWYIDFRAHHDLGHGLVPPEMSAFPDLPVNTRDADMDPGMTVPPLPYPGWTEVSFSLFQIEIAMTACQVAVAFPTEAQDRLVDACWQKIDSLYLRYCDGTEPIHWLAKHVAHVLIMELRFRIHNKPSPSWPVSHSLSFPSASQDHLFQAAVEILDMDRRIAFEPDGLQWSWLLGGYMQFWPLRFVLSELCHRLQSEPVDYAWEVANRSYGRWDTARHSTSSLSGTHTEALSQLLQSAKRAKTSMTLAQTSQTFNAGCVRLPDLVCGLPDDTPALDEDRYLSLDMMASSGLTGLDLMSEEPTSQTRGNVEEQDVGNNLELLATVDADFINCPGYQA